jgi:CRP-like cAMP-binding protein
LKDLSKPQLRLLAGCASQVRFEPGQVIFEEGEEANHFYLVRHGKVALITHAAQRGEILIQTVDEGDVLGWSWIVPPYRWCFDAQAKTLTRAIAFDGKCLRAKCEKNHQLGYELLKRFSCVIADRLRAARMQLMDVYGEAR